MATNDDLLAAVLKLDASVTQAGGLQASMLQTMLGEVNRNLETLYLDSVLALHQIRDGKGGGLPPGGAAQPAASGQSARAPTPTVGDRPPTAPKGPGLFRRAANAMRGGVRTASAAGRRGGMAATASGGLGAAAKVAGPVGVAATFSAALLEAGQAVKGFAYEQEAVARRLAQISPSQAANIAQLDANRTFRDLDYGEDTAKSGGGLLDAIDKFEEMIQPVITLLTNIYNSIGESLISAMTDIIGFIIKVLNVLIDTYNAIPLLADVDRIGERKAADGGPEMFGDFLTRVAAEQEEKVSAAKAKIDDARNAFKKKP